jgi:hypothetical protein
MALKLNREYLLDVETVTDSHIHIERPFTIEFSVSRDNLAGASRASITVYNLSEGTRNQLFKDRYDQQLIRRRAVQLSAGYEDQKQLAPEVTGPEQLTASQISSISMVLPMIFNGELWSCYSMRQGTEFRTQMDCYDGGAAYRESFTSGTEGLAPAGISIGQFVGDLAKTLPGISGVTVGPSFNAEATTRGLSVFGNTVDIIRDLTGGHFFIDNGHAYILDDGEVIPGDLPVIDSSAGLLGSPVRSETNIEITMLFEPRLRVGQLITLKSTTAKFFNGDFKVVGLRHQGIISESVGGQCTTMATLFNGKKYVMV